ncbi:unnamed protein product [Hapterophycus canaliculatus]
MVAAVAAALKEKPDDYERANVSPASERLEEDEEGAGMVSAPTALAPSRDVGSSPGGSPAAAGEADGTAEEASEESRLPRAVGEPPPAPPGPSAASSEEGEVVALAPVITAAAAGIGSFASRAATVSAISAARAQPAAEAEADRSGNDSPGVARYPGSSTDGSWNELGGRGASPLVGLSFAHSPRSALSLSDDTGGGSSSGTASVATGTGSVTGAGGSSHSSGELSYSPNPAAVAARALVRAASRPVPVGEWAEGGAIGGEGGSGGGGGGGRAAAAAESPAASSLSFPGREGAAAESSVGRHDIRSDTGPEGGSNLLTLEAGEAGASPDGGAVAPLVAGDRGRGAGHRSDFRAGSTSGSPSPRRQGQQEGSGGHREHLLPLERGLP